MPLKDEKRFKKTGIKKKSISDLSNMVFGLALSLGALSLINGAATTSQSIAYNLFTFGFSFLILIYVWFRYSSILDIVKVETGIEVNLNIILLFLVIIEPYLFYLLRSGSVSILNYTSGLFSLDVAGTLLVLAIFYSIGLKKYKKFDNGTIIRYRYSRIALIAGGALFLISAVPFFGIGIRSGIWILSLLLGTMLRRTNLLSHFVK